jgi:hypothetical protein
VCITASSKRNPVFRVRRLLDVQQDREAIECTLSNGLARPAMSARWSPPVDERERTGAVCRRAHAPNDGTCARQQRGRCIRQRAIANRLVAHGEPSEHHRPISCAVLVVQRSHPAKVPRARVEGERAVARVLHEAAAEPCV